jgi:serine/threonine protein kinase
MTAGVGTQSGSNWATSSSGARLAPGFQLGDYRLGAAMFPLRIADAYRAEGPAGPVTIYVVHAAVAGNPAVRDHVIAGTRAAAALPEHKHLVRTIAAGLTGDILWIATEEVEGSLVRDLLTKKKVGGNAGLGSRATGNLIAGVAQALGDTHHGALGDESVAVSRTGRVRVVDLALGPGTLAAMIAGLIPSQSSIAPEALVNGTPSAAGDVYGVGALLYEALVGSPLERGGARPSEVVKGLNSQIDEIVARACHREADKRFGRADVLGEVVAEALNKGGAVMTSAVPLIEAAPTLDQIGQQASLASEIAASSAPGMPAAAASSSGIDRVLAVALADSTEKWLISKGKYDYGPFSLADVIKQIEKGDIVAGNIIMDKDTGARVKVDEHPLLGPMVETSRQKRDDARRAQAEVAVQSRDKKRGVMLYVLISLGVCGVGAAVYFVIDMVSDSKTEKIAGVEGPDKSDIKIKINEPKKPPPAQRSGGGRRSGGGGPAGNYSKGTENMSLDLAGDGDEGNETLDMGRVFQTYSKYGGQLGGCLQSTGEGSANIYINIDGPSGRVGFVKVNGKQAGPLYGCLNRVLRGMKFPSINGPRTRAEFDISM